MIETLNILEGFDLTAMGLIRPIIFIPGGSAQARICRPRHVLWRSEILEDSRRAAAFQGVRRGTSETYRPTRRRWTSAPATSKPIRPSIRSTRIWRAAKSTTRCWRKTRPASTPSIRMAWPFRLRHRARGCRRVIAGDTGIALTRAGAKFSAGAGASERNGARKASACDAQPDAGDASG